jgi:hypothetical protein
MANATTVGMQDLRASHMTQQYRDDEGSIHMADDTKPTPRKRGPVAGTEEARRGGQAVRARYGHDFFARIGKKGGETVRREHGSEFYSEIGKKGGQSTKRRQGTEFYQAIGKKGGQANRKAPTEGE